MSDNLIFIPVATNGSEQYLGVEAVGVRKGVFELVGEPSEEAQTPYRKGDHVRCEIMPVETPYGEEILQVVTGKAEKA